MCDMMRKINLHTHTCYCRHGSGHVADYMIQAEKAGIEALCFSEHIPLPDGVLRRSRMDLKTLPLFLAEVDKAEKDFPGIRFLRGFEGENVPELMNFQRELKEALSLDYLIASNHGIWRDGALLPFPETDDPGSLKLVAEQTIGLIESGLGLFLAHPDMFFAYGCPWSAESRAVSKAIIECAKSNRLPLEINAYGMRKTPLTDAAGVHRFRYPVRQFWELAAETGGVEVVCNSDAHTPESVWEAVPECLAWAGELGLPVVNGRLAESLPKR